VATPSLFRARKALEWLNTAAVGITLAAATSSVFRAAMSGDGPRIVYVTAIPTLILGTIWARVLRSPKTLGSTTFRVGWLMSLPLAVANAALAGALLMCADHHGGGIVERFFLGLMLGATFGVIFWLPGLLLTLFCFGLPIASAQGLAKKGLAGEERGERLVGLACVAVASLAFAFSFVNVETWRPFDPVSVGLVRALAVLGGALGLVAAWIARQREAARRAFVADVEAGRVPHFRVDASSEGKVLVRVLVQGQGYRVTDYVEEVAALDREGEVTRAVRDE
jgi:hypothetical protein